MSAREETASERRVATLAYCVVVLAAVATALTGGRGKLPWHVGVEATALSLGYLAVAVVYLRVQRGRVAAYLAFQSAFAAAIVWAGQGVTAVVCLPTLSHCAFVLRRRWVLLIAALQAANVGLVTWRWYGWEVALRSVTEFAAAETFVVAFTWLAAGERRARRELAAANRKLAEYATQSEELATAQERNRLARELHDSLGHYLTVVHVQIQAAASQLEIAPSRARQALTKAARLTHEGLEDVRRSVAALRASPMHGRPLAASIGGLVDDLSASGTPAALSLFGTERPLAPQVELTVYRGAQEGLTNVRKHARASRTEVVLEYAATYVRLTVANDGSAPASPAGDDGSGFGLLGVRERARLVGGDLEIRRDGGFSITLTIPA